MAERERGGNPLGWVLLGFIAGVAATFGLLLMFSGDPGYEDTGREEPSAADGALVEPSGSAGDLAGAPRSAPVGSPNAEPVVVLPDKAAAPPVAPSAPTPSSATPSGPSQRSIDAQVADDAAASGMTSRAGAEEQPTN